MNNIPQLTKEQIGDLSDRLRTVCSIHSVELITDYLKDLREDELPCLENIILVFEEISTNNPIKEKSFKLEPVLQALDEYEPSVYLSVLESITKENPDIRIIEDLYFLMDFFSAYDRIKNPRPKEYPQKTDGEEPAPVDKYLSEWLDQSEDQSQKVKDKESQIGKSEVQKEIFGNESNNQKEGGKTPSEGTVDINDADLNFQTPNVAFDEFEPSFDL